jgi:hypothetical protein
VDDLVICMARKLAERSLRLEPQQEEEATVTRMRPVPTRRFEAHLPTAQSSPFHVSLPTRSLSLSLTLGGEPAARGGRGHATPCL